MRPPIIVLATVKLPEEFAMDLVTSLPNYLAAWNDGVGMLILIAAAGFAVIVVIFIIVLNAFYRTVEQGRALIINRIGKSEPKVSFTGSIVIPVIHRAEVMDISVKTIEVDRQGANGLICKDNIRGDIKVTFFVRVNKTDDDVKKVASAVGVVRASDQVTMENLFQAKFSEALKTVGKQMEFVDLYNERDTFKEEIIKVIGRDLNGYSLEDAAIDYIEQTPLKLLDPDNILDSEGRKKIIELTAIQAMKSNEIQREAQKTIKKQDVEAREAILALERQQAEAEAKQHREIATVTAREKAEQHRVEAEQHRLAEEARLNSEREIGVTRENTEREIQVAGKNREGAVAVESERIEKERQLEAITRERAVAVSQIEKEKIIAVERKNIAEVIRQRVAVEKTVAEEEERTKDIRAFMEADRKKQVAVTEASSLAEAIRVKEVAAAQASEQASVHAAKEKIVLAEADQTAAERDAAAAIRRSEGRRAEVAADGLAKAQVMEAEAEAIRKRGLADVAIKEASANAIAQVGLAEANALEQKMTAEAKGLAEKAKSMSALTAETKAHEEFRIKLDKQVEIAKEQIHVDGDIARENAKVMAQAMGHARIDIVGGDGAFFDRFAKAISFGKSIDGAVDRSDTLRALGGEWLDGRRSLPEDITSSIKALGADDVRDLSLATMLPKLFAGKDPAKIAGLLEQAKKLGLIDGGTKD
jgi:uncharacterized membrane protein YqiK